MARSLGGRRSSLSRSPSRLPSRSRWSSSRWPPWSRWPRSSPWPLRSPLSSRWPLRPSLRHPSSTRRSPSRSQSPSLPLRPSRSRSVQAPAPLPVAEPIVVPEPVVAARACRRLPSPSSPRCRWSLPSRPPLPSPSPWLPHRSPRSRPRRRRTPSSRWSVLLQLNDGDRVEIGAFHSAGEAKEHAQHVVRQISSEHGWPFFGGRFIRPDAIVSVDLAEPEGRWLGSAAAGRPGASDEQQS